MFPRIGRKLTLQLWSLLYCYIDCVLAFMNIIASSEQHEMDSNVGWIFANQPFTKILFLSSCSFFFPSSSFLFFSFCNFYVMSPNIEPIMLPLIATPSVIAIAYKVMSCLYVSFLNIICTTSLKLEVSLDLGLADNMIWFLRIEWVWDKANRKYKVWKGRRWYWLIRLHKHFFDHPSSSNQWRTQINRSCR